MYAYKIIFPFKTIGRVVVPKNVVAAVTHEPKPLATAAPALENRHVGVGSQTDHQPVVAVTGRYRTPAVRA